MTRYRRSMEFELVFAVELNAKCLFSSVIHWMPLSEWQKTLESQAKHAHVVPSGTTASGKCGVREIPFVVFAFVPT